MIINRANLSRLFTGFSVAFNQGMGMAPSQWQQVATRVPSTTSEEKYGWLGKLPAVREWLGDRVVHGIALHDYAIKNKDWELTLGVDRNSIDDDTYGVMNPLFQEMGMQAQAHPDRLVFTLLKNGFSTLCYDGQNFFDTDHPVLDANGEPVSVANTDGGAGEPWFLMDASRPLKPVIFQERKAFKFVARDKETDDNVFDRKEYKYGVDSRSNVGFGFWQFAWGSKQTLDAEHYEDAREALLGMKADGGNPLGIGIGGKKLLLVTGPANEGAARRLLNRETLENGESNEWKDTAELFVTPWLAA
jgi:phage major head subunit gpT-like protein